MTAILSEQAILQSTLSPPRNSVMFRSPSDAAAGRGLGVGQAGCVLPLLCPQIFF